MKQFFSIHTFEIACYVSKFEYFEILNSFFYYSKEMRVGVMPIDEQCPKGYIFTFLKDYGVNRVEFRQMGVEAEYRRRISFIVNPRRLLNIQTHPYICIIPPERLEEVPKVLDSLIQTICPKFPSIFCYGIITRIDYCTNICMESKERAKRYLNILKQGYIGTHFEAVMQYDKKEKRKCFKHGRMTLKTSYYTFEIYLKREQMEQYKYCYDEEEMLDAECQIRFELRAKRRKIRALENKYKPDTEAEFLWSSPFIAEKELERVLTGLYGTGDFYNTDTAKEIINGSSHQKSVKEKMIKIIDLTKQTKSLTETFKILDMTNINRNIYFKYFNELGINPITFGKPGSYYKNPMYYIKEANSNED